MAKKLIDLEEAAKMLGVPPDTLSEMRGRHEITGYRDGASWKFKAEDIERLARERAAGDRPDEGEFAELEDPSDSILLSEVEMGDSGPGASSTIIGKTNAPSSDSDIRLAEPDPRSGSGLGSDLRPAGSSNVLQGGAGLSAKFDDLDALDLDLPSPQESGIGLGSSGLKKAASGSDLSLDDRDLSLGEAPADDPIPSTGSSKKGPLSASDSKGGGSAIDLAAEEDDELVLGGSSGSDITRSATDSGISLMDPSDSGLSLDEQPLELSGSAVESLELGEEDMLELDDKHQAAEPQLEEDFMLTPPDDHSGDDSDSGSQVIAIDSEGEADSSSTLIMSGPGLGLSGSESDSGSGFGSGLGSDLGGGLGSDLGLGAGHGAVGLAPAATMAAGGPVMIAARAPEATYSAWNIAALALPVFVLMITGMMMYDLVRNMWSWEGTYPVNSTLMDKITGMF